MALVDEARGAETSLTGEAGPLTRAVAWNFYKLMAYKDEYEVARLYTDGRFEQRIREAFEGDFSIEFNLAPPLLARKGKASDFPRKRAFGPWMMPVLRLLAKFKGLRGTAFDPFGYQAERREERAMAEEYERLIAELCKQLPSVGLDNALAAARRPEAIAGFGYVKQRSINAAAAAALAVPIASATSDDDSEADDTKQKVMV